MQKVLCILKYIDSLIDRGACVGLVFSVFMMISLTLMNMGARWFDVSFLWVEPLVRYLVFFSAFLGGLVATGAQKHLAIDLAPKILEYFDVIIVKKIIQILISLLCMSACIWLVFAGYEMYKVEFEYGKIEFLNIHSSILVAMVPLGFSLLSYRFFVSAMENGFSK